MSHGKDGKEPPWKTPKSVSHFLHSSDDAYCSQAEFAMGAEPARAPGSVASGKRVDEDQVGLDVAVAMILPLACQGVVVERLG